MRQIGRPGMRGAEFAKVPRKRARIAARYLAQETYQKDDQGSVVLVASPIAVKVLERAYTLLIMRGRKSFAMQLSEREALAFPCPPNPSAPGMVYAIAVCEDIDGKVALATGGAAVNFAPEAKPSRRDVLAARAWAYKTAARSAREKLAVFAAVSGLSDPP